jgi:hypothetical protein
MAQFVLLISVWAGCSLDGTESPSRMWGCAHPNRAHHEAGSSCQFLFSFRLQAMLPHCVQVEGHKGGVHWPVDRGCARGPNMTPIANMYSLDIFPTSVCMLRYTYKACHSYPLSRHARQMSALPIDFLQFFIPLSSSTSFSSANFSSSTPPSSTPSRATNTRLHVAMRVWARTIPKKSEQTMAELQKRPIL